MGMLETGGELNFPPEPVGVDPGGEIGWQDLDHDAPVEPALFGHKDATHPATPELSLEVVRVTERSLQALAEFGQLNGL
jgi:hypothetical protein